MSHLYRPHLSANLQPDRILTHCTLQHQFMDNIFNNNSYRSSSTLAVTDPFLLELPVYDSLELVVPVGDLYCFNALEMVFLFCLNVLEMVFIVLPWYVAWYHSDQCSCWDVAGLDGVWYRTAILPDTEIPRVPWSPLECSPWRKIMLIYIYLKKYFIKKIIMNHERL